MLKMFVFTLSICMLIQNAISGMKSFESLDQSKKKVGILSLSAIKLKPLIEERYTIGDLSVEKTKTLNDLLHDAGYVANNYTSWLESAGMQAVPIVFFKSLQEISELMDQVDGFVLTGGSESFYNYEGFGSIYLKTVQFILKKAKQINDSGRVFPLWGTCLGFESLLAAESGTTLKRHKVYNHMKLREKITVVNADLRSVKFFTDDELDQMENIPLLYFNHMFGILRKDIFNLPELNENVLIGAKINTDERMNVAVWMEFKDYPFFGSQFHPEKESISGANPFNQNRKGQEGFEINYNKDGSNDEILPENFTASELGDYNLKTNQKASFFNFKKITQPENKDTLKKNTNPERDDGENDADGAGEFFNERRPPHSKKFVKPINHIGQKSKDAYIKKSKANNVQLLDPLKMKGVHIAVEHEVVEKEGKKDQGVDSIGEPIVSDPSYISSEYLNLVAKINNKFATFFSGFVTAKGGHISKKFLNKQILWLKNIGSYYEVNVINDHI